MLGLCKKVAHSPVLVILYISKNYLLQSEDLKNYILLTSKRVFIHKNTSFHFLNSSNINRFRYLDLKNEQKSSLKLEYMIFKHLY